MIDTILLNRESLIIWTLTTLLLCNLLGLILSFLPFLSKKIFALRIQKKPIPFKTFKKRLPLISFNFISLCLLSSIGLYYLFPLFNPAAPLSFGVISVQLAIIFFLDDLFFYLFHRWMHKQKYILKKIHSIHHKATAPFALDYLYVHPLEWLIGYIGPFIGILLIGIFDSINYWAFFIYTFMRTVHELDIHSGFPSFLSRYIPLWGESEHHDLHHEKLLGNYASTFTIWDSIFKTKI